MKHTPFNGDHHIGEEIKRLIARFNVQTIIETGTWSAHSTREFVQLVPLVFTIDATHEHLIEEFGPRAVAELEAKNIGVLLGDSSVVLPMLLKPHQQKKSVIYPALIYLDAHGGGANGSKVNPYWKNWMRSAARPRVAITALSASMTSLCLASPGATTAAIGGADSSR